MEATNKGGGRSARRLAPRLAHRLARMLADTRGATAVEYGLLVALIGAGMYAAAATLGGDLNGAFTDMAGCLNSDGSNGPKGCTIN